MPLVRKQTIGLHTAYPSGQLLDLAVQAGFDFVWLDAEHTGLHPRGCAEAVGRISGHGVEAFVRVPSLDPDLLTTYANTGVDEVVLPRLRSLAELQGAWEALRYAPEGRRSRQVVPATRYGADWTKRVRISVIIETAEAVDLADEIAAAEQVDGVWLGPRDLEDDLRRRGAQVDMAELVAGLEARLRGRRPQLGVNAVDEAGLRRAFERGADRCTLYWDVYLRERLVALAAIRPERP